MTAAMDPYGVLGLQPGASQAEIKRAYRRLAKALHPDSAGERSLPAFLAVQDAYERLTGTKVRTVRPAGPAAPAAQAPTGGAFREPWRADPARARAAREQARTRTRGAGGTGPATPGGPSSSTREAGGASAWAQAEQRARPTSGPGRRAEAGGPPSGASDPGGRGARGRATNEAAAGGAASDGTGGTGSRRRRSTRKATMGSTSYDEARDATDPRWAGASWYGPTTGEYWIVNPREYADPRKHGPGYSSRLRTGSGDTAAEPASEDTSAEEVRPPAPEAARPPVAEAMDSGPRASAAEARGWEPAPDAPFLESIVRSGSSDPLRRLGLVLLAWAPAGIAAAAIIGQLTGCASYSATCDGTDPFLPWVAQAVIVGLLLVVPPLARVFAAGTLGLVAGLVPATGLVIAFGGAGSSAAPPVLAAVLAIAWILGVAWGARHLVSARPSERPAAPPGDAT